MAQAGYERLTMNEYTPQRPGGFTPVKMIVLGVILTLAIILGIKYFIASGPDSGEEGSRASGNAADIFKADPQTNPNPGYNPARRAESLGGGGSIEMFEKTNAGYAKEDEEEASPQIEGAALSEVKKAATAAPSQTGVNKAAATGTVIPKLQPVKGFGIPSSGAGKTALPKGAAGTPDINSLLQNATKSIPKKPKGIP